MAKYEKKFLNISDQVNLLAKRGLIIDDEDKLRFYLRYINYYHLSAYFKTFQKKEDMFIEETSFNKVLGLYNFDKKLRLLLLDVLEKIEMSLKSALAYEVTNSRSDKYWYLVEKNSYGDVRERVKDIIDKSKVSKEIYINHFFQKYNDEEYLPSWLFFESLSFGECCLIARNLNDSDKQVISFFYKLPKKSGIQMLHHLSLLRNLCAHHSWVWNRYFTTEVSPYKKYKDLFLGINKRSLYPLLIFMQIFIKKISPTSDWLDKLEDIVNEYNIEIYRMGFPRDWKEALDSVGK